MKDIPFFNTENGVASLRLKEIPHFQTAYITIQSPLNEEKLLQDCLCLCRAAGAENVFSNGLKVTDSYDSVDIIKMTRNVTEIEAPDAMLFPVQEETLPQWREIYNKKMRNVTGAAYMNDEVARKMLADKSGYFVHRNGELLGIGTVCGNTISVVASVQKGAGQAVVKALLSAVSEDTAVIEVASDNIKALSLYSSLGFMATGIVNTWYKII